MRYEVELKPRSRKDLAKIPKMDAARIVVALEAMQQDLAGDVKRLTNHSPEYRLRVGDYRVLFEVDHPNHVVVYRVRHRRDPGHERSNHAGRISGVTKVSHPKEPVPPEPCQSIESHLETT